MALAKNNIATRPLNEKRCHLCGAPIAGLHFFQEGEEYCCEWGFLGRKECRGIEVERGNAYLVLAEAQLQLLKMVELKCS